MPGRAGPVLKPGRAGPLLKDWTRPDVAPLGPTWPIPPLLLTLPLLCPPPGLPPPPCSPCPPAAIATELTPSAATAVSAMNVFRTTPRRYKTSLQDIDKTAGS
jgi:hypothetical protein